MYRHDIYLKHLIIEGLKQFFFSKITSHFFNKYEKSKYKNLFLLKKMEQSTVDKLKTKYYK